MKKNILGRTITMRIDEELLNDFKRVCGAKYQYKIRELMKKYIEDTNKELNKRIIKDKSINVDFLTK